MKVNGKEVKNPYTRTVVIPRGADPKSEDYVEYVFVLRSVRKKEVDDYFDKLPEIKPPFKQVMGQDPEPVLNFDDKGYREKLQKRHRQRVSYHFLLSIGATEGLSWSKVDFENPDTFELFEEELEEAGFNNGEIERLIQESVQANGMNSDYIDQATNRFLASTPEKKES